MNDALDKLSFAAKLATDILFVKNPVGTSMGALFGIILDGALNLSAPFIGPIQAIKSSGIGLLHFVAIGIFGFNFKTWLKRDEVDPKIKEALDFIEDQVKQGRLSRSQAKLKYNEIITKVVENVRLDDATADGLNKLAR